MKIAIHLNPNCVQEFTFQPYKLNQDGDVVENVFQRLEEPLGDFIKKEKFAHLKDEVYANHQSSIRLPLGTFLISNKKSGEDFYKKFLKHSQDRNEETGDLIKNVLTGDSKYRSFTIQDDDNTRKVGLYIYSLSNNINGIKYIGSCYQKGPKNKNSFLKRVKGYAKIDPYNTLLNGQGTNVRINPKIYKHWENLSFWICPIENNKDQILYYEKCLIKKIWENGNILWNIQAVPKGRPPNNP
jgi:hypothetical protein